MGGAFNKAFAKANFLSRFKKTGTSPFNDEAFDDCDFLSSYIIDPTVERITPKVTNNIGN